MAVLIRRMMKQDFERIYRQLKYWGLANNQYEYSKMWLGQCPSYYSSIKARQLSPNLAAILSLIARLDGYNKTLKQTDMPRTNAHMHQLSNMLEQEADLLTDHLFQTGITRVAKRMAQTTGEVQ